MYRAKSYACTRSRAALWLMILSLTFMLMVSVSGVALAIGTVTGHVFRDYNANGVQDTDEPNVAGVTIDAFDSTGANVGTATSFDTPPPANPLTTTNYSITWIGTDTRVRLEFSGLPGVAQQGAFGAGSGTSVQFVDAGAVANYGINRPSDYCLATPNLQLVTTCFELGDQSSTTDQVVVSHAYTAPAAETSVAFANQVGTAWGVAYKRAVGATGGIVYVSAFAKRQADYGPGGQGAIYAIQQPANTVTTLATIPGAGATAHTAPYAIDANFYGVPGTESLGDMDISEDGTTLYVVNLANKNLYSVATVGGAVTPLGVIGNPACVNGEYRPFGLGIRDGLVYVGGVCDASGAAGTPANLQAYVFSYNPVGGAVAQVLTFPLNYPRGCTDIDPTYGNPAAPIACRTTANGSQADWQPWRDVWPNPNATPPGSGFSPNPGGDEFFAYPQPILSGIEFVGEDMVVSFRDRMGDQIGYQDNGPDALGGAFPDQLITVTAGDILRASPLGAGWTIENAAAGTTFGPSGGNANEQGPGGGEFYFGDNFANNHDETISGGITVVPGSGEVAAEVMDPAGLFSAGTAWFNNGTGVRNRSFTIIPATAPFGKGNGLGDLAPMCDSAPIEIGNYVWFDADQDGVQDPDEQPLPGIQVQLFDPATNTVIATATTDANGQYIFSNAAGTSTGNLIYGLPIAQSTAYQVRIATNQPPLAGYSPTLPNVGGAPADMHDSDGDSTITPNFVVTNVTTGTAGQNNHTLDFGFFTPPYSLGNRVWFDNGAGGGTADDGLQNGAEAGIDGVTVNLLDSTGNIIATTVTAGGGYYLFDNLLPGTYTVQIPASNFAVGGPLNGLNSSGGAGESATPNDDIDLDDNGIGTVPDPTNGIVSGPITLGPPGPSEPLNEPGGPLGSGTATDANSNLTVDFGFFGTPVTYSLGNRVWLDSNNSGIIDPGELGIGGVTLNLYTVTNGVTSPTPLRTTTTTANGYYLFDNLPAGDYVVEVAPASCSAGGPLAGLTNSTGAGQEADPNLDGDSNDNGLDSTGTCSVRSGIVTLGPGGSEPIGETDLGPQGSGVATDDHSNLTVDFGYFGTPRNPQTPVAPITLDPLITKQVDPAFAQPGDEVRWTITLHNPHAVAINNVSFVDNFPGQLEILTATVDTAGGSLVVSGNTVTYSIVVMNPGQTINVHVLTRIRIGTPVPFIITNSVKLNGSSVVSASATVLSVGSLPATGFEPPWRAPLLIGMGVLLVLFGIGTVRALQRGYRSQ